MLSIKPTCSHTEYCIQKVPIFNHLKDHDMKEVMSVVRTKELAKNEHMFHAGNQSNGLYVVHRGKVRIYRLSEDGKEQLVRLLLPGDFTGELALFQSDYHSSYAQALTESQICWISQDDINYLLTRYPSISIQMLSALAKRLEDAEKQTARFATEPVAKRIAHFLQELMSVDETTCVQLPMTRKDLAFHLGTTPETVSRELHRFEKNGYLTQKSPKQIDIHDIDQMLE